MNQAPYFVEYIRQFLQEQYGTNKLYRAGLRVFTTVNQEYLNRDQLKVKLLGRGHTWLDTGTHDSLLEASQFVQTLEKRQGMKISCIEEIAFRMGYIEKEQLISLGKKLVNSQYGQYLLKIADFK